MPARKTAFMKWVDRKIASDAELKRMVEENLAEMRLEQELATLREKLGITQRELATRMGVTQPAIAKLESGPRFDPLKRAIPLPPPGALCFPRLPPRRAARASAWILAQLGEASEALNHLREGEQLLEPNAVI